MVEAQLALLAYTRRADHGPKTHKQRVQELRKASKDFVDPLERSAHNPPSKLADD